MAMAECSGTWPSMTVGLIGNWGLWRGCMDITDLHGLLSDESLDTYYIGLCHDLHIEHLQHTEHSQDSFHYFFDRSWMERGFDGIERYRLLH